MELCQLVNKSAFTNKIVQIGLLDRQVAKNFDASDDSDNVDSEEKEKPLNTDYNSYKINLFSGLCESPNAINSNLSKNAVSFCFGSQLHSSYIIYILSIFSSSSYTLDIYLTWNSKL